MEETGVNEQTRKPNFNPLLISTIILAAAVVFGLLYIFYLQPQGYLGSIDGGQVVATVNGEKITRDDLYEVMYEEVGDAALEELILKSLILQEGKRLGLSVSEAEIDEELDKIIEMHFDGMEEQLLMAMEYYGMTIASFRESLRLGLMEEKIAMSKLEYTEEEVREFFDENREYFNISDSIELRHIMLETEEEALAVIALLEDSEDFAAVAEEHSLDYMTALQGGDLGVINRGDSVYGFEDDAFALEAGQISAPMSSYYGYHVVEVLGKTDGREVTFEEVKEDVEESYTQYLISLILNEIRNELINNADINIL